MTDALAAAARLNVERPEDAMIHVQDATVVFDGFKALDIDSFSVRRNEVRVVIGPNGAGKTTLCDVISGKTPLTTGRVFFDGKEVTRARDFEIARLGVGRKFQTPAVFGSLTVKENLALAAPLSRSVMNTLFGRPTPGDNNRIEAIAASLGLDALLDVEAEFLSHGQRQGLEIGTLLVSKPKLLLIDEPAAGLTDQETSTMASLIRRLSGQHTVIVIEHDMDFVRELDAQVTVLNEGRILAEGPMPVVQADERVIEAYLGR